MKNEPQQKKSGMSEEQMIYILEMCDRVIEKTSKQSWISKMRDKFCI